MIGVFDSGFGGLTILKELVSVLPETNFIYLGDNARAPYGGRSFETIHRYTLEAVSFLFAQGCPLVILACNTASARALRTIQCKDLPTLAPNNRVLGIIRPIVEEVGYYTQTGHVGVLGTKGTILSESYAIEIAKLWPHLTVRQQACPLWVPIVENGVQNTPGARYFVETCLQELLESDPLIDTLVLGCTHYPLLQDLIESCLPPHVRIVAQGPIVAQKTTSYLSRHPEINQRMVNEGWVRFMTTDTRDFFERGAENFWKRPMKVESVRID